VKCASEILEPGFCKIQIWWFGSLSSLEIKLSIAHRRTSTCTFYAN